MDEAVSAATATQASAAVLKNALGLWSMLVSCRKVRRGSFIGIPLGKVYGKTASLRLLRGGGAGGFLDCCVVPARGTRPSNYFEREIREGFVFRAALLHA